jgi:hypothetical protein
MEMKTDAEKACCGHVSCGIRFSCATGDDLSVSFPMALHPNDFKLEIAGSDSGRKGRAGR